MTRVRAPQPDDLVVFSFGPAPGGALPDAATAVAERYSSAEVIEIVSSRDDTTEQGLRAWVASGIGRVPAGPHNRFLAMAVDAPSGTQAIVVRLPSGPAVLDLLPEIERGNLCAKRIALPPRRFTYSQRTTRPLAQSRNVFERVHPLAFCHSTIVVRSTVAPGRCRGTASVDATAAAADRASAR